MAKQKAYELAYVDYKDGKTYQQIADKYKVSLAAVRAWQQRYWRKMMDDIQDIQDSGNDMQNSLNDSGNIQDDIQAESMKLDISKGEKCFTVIANKQIEDTLPDKIMAYTSDNLPEIEPKQARFVREYLIDMNQRQAAIRAGYPISNADNIASRLMNDAKVSAHVQAVLAERDRRTSVNQDLVVLELAKLLRVKPSNVIDLETGEILNSATEEDLAAIQSVKVKCVGFDKETKKPVYEREVRFYDKNKTSELLMKSMGMLIERKQIDMHTTIETMTSEERERKIQELLAKRNTIDITPE